MLFELKKLMMAVGACGKPSAVFQGAVGAFCASTGPAASTAFFCTRLGVARPDGDGDPGPTGRALGVAGVRKRLDLQVVPWGRSSILGHPERLFLSRRGLRSGWGGFPP